MRALLKKAFDLGKRPLIRIKIRGNLGDQLYLYALGIHLQAINKERIGYDLEEFSLFRYYAGVADVLCTRLQHVPRTQSPVTLVLRGILIKLLFTEKAIYDDFPLAVRRAWFQSNTYTGRFQDLRFFELSSEKIIKQFDFADCLNSAELIAIKKEILASKSIGVHIVRSEFYLNSEQSKELADWPAIESESFYIEAINDYRRSVSDATFFVFTDNPDWCKRFLPVTQGMRFIEGFNEESLAYMYLLSCCQFQITSRNSFGWWSFWLGQHKKNNT